MYKTLRDLARICSILRDHKQELHYEESAFIIYQDLHDLSIEFDSEAFSMAQLPVDGQTINIKVFKLLMNRAMRLKQTDLESALKMFLWL